MPRLFNILRPLALALPPETAHRLAFPAFRLAAMTARGGKADPVLATAAAGLRFTNPVGLAAGFDKNAEIPCPLLAAGFGFVEAGTLTPKPQPGNPKPRLFRLVEDEALINRLGFNNKGFEPALARIVKFPKAKRRGVLGINIGANRDSKDPASDYLMGLEAFFPHADYIALNISSPNTPGLRELQAARKLDPFLKAVVARSTKLAGGRKGQAVPLFLKISPDLERKELQAIVRLAEKHGLAGLIISNTTSSRPAGLKSPSKGEPGGLSGKPLFSLSTQVLKDAYGLSHGRLVLIGAGGVSCGADAYAKILAGAPLVQFYTGLVYHGPGLVLRIRRELAEFLRKDGFNSLSEAVGKGA